MLRTLTAHDLTMPESPRMAGALLYVKASEKRDTSGLDYLCGILPGLAALSKIHAVALGPAFATVALASSPPNWRRGLRLLATSLAIAALYPIYGLLLDAHIYIAVVSWLAKRYPVVGEGPAEKLLILPRFILGWLSVDSPGCRDFGRYRSSSLWSRPVSHGNPLGAAELSNCEHAIAVE